ncbi:hypothetical protein GCM10023321_71590 [Pseudonocardia eucalypti]|uniref:Uncharacterized protein n=1 Tax=Pseudonocardia eucalypti TaxID=648755 RepID=A0ABP9R5T9_9PSEU
MSDTAVDADDEPGSDTQLPSTAVAHEGRQPCRCLAAGHAAALPRRNPRGLPLSPSLCLSGRSAAADLCRSFAGPATGESNLGAGGPGQGTRPAWRAGELGDETRRTADLTVR